MRTPPPFGLARRQLLALLSGLAVLASLVGPSLAQQQERDETGQPEPEPTQGQRGPFRGSLGPDVYFEDLTYTLRLASLRTIAISPHDPNVAYMGSFDGYVWKTVDGGQTWDESRLILEVFPFYGDGGERLYYGVHRFPMSPGIGAPFYDPDSGYYSGIGSSFYTEWNYARQPFRSSMEQRMIFVYDSGGGGGGGGGNSAFGVGVPGGAPRLQLLVRKFGKVPGGINIKMTLGRYGYRPTEVRSIVIHPKDPNTVFACTAYGLFRTKDGGKNWVRTFLGTSPGGRFTFHLVIDPNDHNKVLLATSEGLFISLDGGENFMKSGAPGVGGGTINWLYFNPYDSKVVFAGTNSGLLRSPDGGDNWEWIYYTTFPTASVVRSIVIDPFDKRTGYITTHDGMFKTPDILQGSLESWTRMGGLQFTGIEVSNFAACPKHKGHLWALTNMNIASVSSGGLTGAGGSFIWESLDGGETWKTMFNGTTSSKAQWFENDPKDPDLLWIVFSHAITRMRRRSASTPMPAKVTIPDDPPVTEVVSAAHHYFGVAPDQQLAYRDRVRLKSLLPYVTLFYINEKYYQAPRLFDGTLSYLPFRYYAPRFERLRDKFEVVFMWDLSDLVFDLRQTLFGREDRLNGEIRDYVKEESRRFYGELRRLRILMANAPPRDLRVRLMYKLRIEELTSYLNFITGNYLERWKRGDQPRGEDTKWWEPWALRPEAR